MVRCLDRTVFPVNRNTLEAMSCGYYDAYCYTDPKKDVDYLEYTDWLNQKDKLWKQNLRNSIR